MGQTRLIPQAQAQGWEGSQPHLGHMASGHLHLG